MPGRRHWLQLALRDAGLALVASAALALGVNALRPGGLPLVAARPYQVLVPCPDTGGRTAPVGPGEAGRPGDLLVDARPEADHAAWHAPGAIGLPFDYLEPASEATVQRLAKSGARRVVVYGDGQTPDTGRELARELSARGVRNVVYVAGGAPALRARGSAP